jgi:hypothetical protein
MRKFKIVNLALAGLLLHGGIAMAADITEAELTGAAFRMFACLQQHPIPDGVYGNSWDEFKEKVLAPAEALCGREYIAVWTKISGVTTHDTLPLLRYLSRDNGYGGLYHMARRGRPRKAGKRELSGGLQRASRPDRRAALQRVEEEEIAHALRQPHRRTFNGSARSQLAADADKIGRFVLLHRLDEKMYDSACSFAKLIRRCLKAAGIKVSSLSGMRQYNVTDIGTAPMERDPQLAMHLGAEIALVESQLRKVASAEGFAAFKNLVVFGIDCPPQHEPEVITSLQRLAEITGFVEPSGEPKRKTRIRHWHDDTPFDATGESVN